MRGYDFVGDRFMRNFVKKFILKMEPGIDELSFRKRSRLELLLESNYYLNLIFRSLKLTSFDRNTWRLTQETEFFHIPRDHKIDASLLEYIVGVIVTFSGREVAAKFLSNHIFPDTEEFRKEIETMSIKVDSQRKFGEGPFRRGK